jgi:hypothetical protein
MRIVQKSKHYILLGVEYNYEIDLIIIQIHVYVFFCDITIIIMKHLSVPSAKMKKVGL